MTKGNGYYGERLLSQAISDPAVDAIDREEVRAYIEREAAKLCLDSEAVADAAMRGYETITTTEFKNQTYREDPGVVL